LEKNWGINNYDRWEILNYAERNSIDPSIEKDAMNGYFSKTALTIANRDKH